MIAQLTFLPSLTANADNSFWQFQWDNDVLVGSDGNFTNGAALTWGMNISPNQNSINWLADIQSTFLFKQNTNYRHWGVSFEQRIWTPEDFEQPLPQPNERPYAGHIQLQSFFSTFNEEFSQRNWLAIGLIGKDSGSEWLQTSIHDLIGSPTPEGWHYQVKDQATIQASYEVEKLLLRDIYLDNYQWEMSAYSYNQLGNLVSEANVGLQFRNGPNLARTFGFLSRHYGQTSDWSRLEKNLHMLYANVQLGYRFNDLTIEGNLPYQSNVEVEHLRLETSFGIIYPFESFTASWSLHFYNRAFASDNHYWHGYSSLAINSNF